MPLKPKNSNPTEEVAKEVKEVLIVPDYNKELSFDELVTKADKIQKKCKDFIVDCPSGSKINYNFSESYPNFEYVGKNKVTFLPSEKGIDSDKRLTYPMSYYALGQLCNKLGVPVTYIDKCRIAGKEDLIKTNLDTWIKYYDRSLLVRVCDERVRGILSSRYLAFDTPDILSVLSEVVDTQDDFYKLKGYLLNPERFHARIIQRRMLKIDGEDLFAGFQVDSSDVGRRSLSVRFFIFKQVCTNGLCIEKNGGVLFEQRHLALNLDTFREGFKKSIKTLPNLIVSAKDFINHCRKEKLNFLTESEMKEFSERLKRSTKLSDDGVKKCLELMTEKYSPTKWGLVNSITEVAQEYSIERRIELEKIAGDMLYSKIAA